MKQPYTRYLSSWARLVALALLLGFGVLASLGLATGTAHAQPAVTSTVTTCDDATLRNAINNAASGDTLTFGCSGDIKLTSTLTISKNLTLDGGGQSVILDGGGSVGVLHVNSGVTFTLNALTVAHGSQPSLSGGGLDNSGTVTITNSTFANNTAALGGGLDNSGTVTITNSTFANNSANFPGGGLSNDGTMTISNSTIAHNSADAGGGLVNNDGATVTISNSTFANNIAAQGGGLRSDSTMTITNSTFANNSASDGGGLSNSDTMSIGGSIVANNTGGNCSNQGTLTDRGYNLESGTDCSLTGTGSLQKTDPLLDPSGLQKNGGTTQTIALQLKSPAIDAIPLAHCPSSDQRGHARPDDASESACDKGAYESDYLTTDNDLGLTNLPANITTTATSQKGAVVTYTPPTATDESGDTTTASVSCTPASGSTFPMGSTTVTCTAIDPDDANSPVSQSFIVAVKDGDLGLTNLPANITTNATSPQGAAVTYTPPTATDESGDTTTASVSCLPASGSIFRIGTATVTCTATDSDDGNSPVSQSFTVTVNDTDLGLNNMPSNITTDATSPQGAAVTYTSPTVVDEDSSLPTANCTPASGSVFPIGTTKVTCTASDSDDTPGSVSQSFTVTVKDVTPPTLILPDTITADATSSQGATVSYTVTATDPDNAASELTISCSPVSGSTFAIGTTTVNCTASDPAGNSSSGSFSVVVKDVTPPTLNLPSPTPVDATSPSGKSVTYLVTATDPDNAASDLTITCSPASGSTFAIGTTTVNCTASDPAGNKATGSFSVVVNGAATQVNELITTVNSFHLSNSLQTTLDNKLQDVLSAVNGGQTATACSELTDFIGHVQSQSGKGLTGSQANQLITAAKQVQAVLGC